MQLRNILNRIQKHKGFVYGTERWGPANQPLSVDFLSGLIAGVEAAAPSASGRGPATTPCSSVATSSFLFGAF